MHNTIRQNIRNRLSIRIIIAIYLCLLQGCSKDPIASEIKRLQDSKDSVRVTATEALGESNDPRVIIPLIFTLQDRASEVRVAAEQALINLGTSEREPSNITATGNNWRLFDLTVRPFVTQTVFIDRPVCGVATEQLLRVIRKDDTDLSRTAAMVLARTPNPRVIDLLASILKEDERSEVRVVAAEALGEMKDPRAIDLLIAAINDRSETVRHIAVSVLGRIGDPLAIAPLVSLLKHSDPRIRKTVAVALRNTEYTAAIEPLIAALKDSNENVREAVIETLGTIKDPQIIHPLIACLKDSESQRIQEVAAQALAQLREIVIETLLASGSSAVEPLIALAISPNESLRENALETLVKVGSAAVDSLLNSVNDTNLNKRVVVIEILGEIKDPRAIPLLITCLKAPTSKMIYEAAIQALAKMDEIVIETLLANGLSSVEPLLVLASSPNEDLRKSSLKALTEIGIEKVSSNSIGMKLVYISSGEFTMDSLDRSVEEGLQRRVQISKGFWMAQTEVTQAQYQAVMGKNPSHFKGSTDLPVENVSWHDAVEFCRGLSEKEGRQYRLPTEAEWEYACRAGTNTIFCFGNNLDVSMANVIRNYPYSNGLNDIYRKKTVSVGTFQPNAWGLYDMHGNVWEWCLDWYAIDNSDILYIDPKGPSSGTSRVLRGGSWGSIPLNCRSANRSSSLPHYLSAHVGFRIVLDL